LAAALLGLIGSLVNWHRKNEPAIGAIPTPVGSNRIVAILIEPGIGAPAGGAQHPGHRLRRHRYPFGDSLRLEPVPRLFLDQQVDQFEPLALVDRFRQQFLVPMIVVDRFLFTHGTPRTRASKPNSF
jgi:hypothetical protein